ncbi:MAG: hypothetical protein CMH62_01990 [Nanoarchaeota archaeon]|nr:hypothetical protein [Nanoarchaeota archaeon]
MKKLTFFIILSLFIVPFVSAQEIDEGIQDITEEDSGIQADSPFYFLDKTLDRINLALTFSEKNRAKLEIKLAEERLREVNLMIQKNKLETAGKVQIAHNKRLEKARARIKGLKDSTDEETIAELESEIEDQELLIEDVDTASIFLPILTESDRITKDRILSELRKSSSETKKRIKERREEIIKLRPEFEERLEEAKKARIKPEIENRIRVILKKIEKSEEILERRPDDAEAKGNLRLAKEKLDAARKELEVRNFEEAKALTLEANKLAVLVRGRSDEAREKLEDIKDIALTREKIEFREKILNEDKEFLKDAIELLREREKDLSEVRLELKKRGGELSERREEFRMELKKKEDERSLRLREETRVDGIRTRTETRLRERDDKVEVETRTKVDDDHEEEKDDDTHEDDDSDDHMDSSDDEKEDSDNDDSRSDTTTTSRSNSGSGSY